MPKLLIDKSIDINADASSVYKKLNDFNHWTTWSPWLIMDPDTKVDVAKDAKSYSWEGKRTGSGNMQILSEEENKSIDYDLNFIKPWKSHALVRFELQEDGNSTKVTWKMDSSIPFFMFWMKKMMTAFVGMDYERGLNMLKDYVENGNVESKLEFKGENSYPGCKYIGIHRETTMSKVGPDMEKDFASIWDFMKGKELLVSNEPFSIYEKWDMVKDKVIYTSGVPVTKVPDNLPANFITGEIPATQVYTLRHIGHYKHLGNAWTTMYSMHRSKEFKPRKKIYPFETYVNIPGEAPDAELITDINFAVK